MQIDLKIIKLRLKPRIAYKKCYPIEGWDPKKTKILIDERENFIQLFVQEWHR